MDPTASRTATVVDGFTFPSNRESSSPSNVNTSSLGLHVTSNNRSNDNLEAPCFDNGPRRDLGANGRALAKESYDYANGTRSPRTPVTPPSVMDTPCTPPSSTKGLSQVAYSVDQEYTPATLPLQESVFFANTIASPTRNRLIRRRSSQKPSLNLIVEDPSPPPISAKSVYSKDEGSPLEQSDVTCFQHASLDVTIENTGSQEAGSGLPSTNVARRSFSMNDLAQHEHDYTRERKMSLTSDRMLKTVDETGDNEKPSIPLQATFDVESTVEANRSVQARSLVREEPLGQPPSEETSPGLAKGEINTSSKSQSRLEPPTITVANASPSALAKIMNPGQGRPVDAIIHAAEKPVAYNPRLPHPAILYAALGGKDIDMSEDFDSNGMFVDTMYRRIGEGGNKVLLQEGEEVKFPSVKNSKRQEIESPTASADDAITPLSLEDPPMRIHQLEWKDDQVFHRSTTSGLSVEEVTHTIHLVRNIHLTAQQQVTGEEELFVQAKHLIDNVAALVHLTEIAQMRQPRPPGMDSSTSDYDSAFTSKTQQKRARKMARRGDHKRHGPPIQTQVQPRHLNSRFGGQKSYDAYSPTRTHDSIFGCPEGVRNQGTVYYSSEPPSSVSSAWFSYPSGLYQPYYSWSPDQYSQVPFTNSWPAWHPSAGSFVSGLPQSPISTRTPAGPVPLAYKSDICRTYWIEGDRCPFRLRCFFVHPAPSAHHTIARDTVASLEDPAGVHLQKYQDAQNLQHLQNMQQAGVDVIASTSSISEPTIAQILEQVQTGSTSGYAVMPLANNSMVPIYPLQPFTNDCVSSTSQGHFIRMPVSNTQLSTTRQHLIPPTPPTQLSSKEEIASYLSGEKAKKRGLPPSSRSTRENNMRRFSTAGPLGRNFVPSIPSSGTKSRAAHRAMDRAVSSIKRPASRTLKQVQQTVLHEDSREGTRLEPNGRGPSSLEIANVIDQVESRLSTRPY